MTPPGVLRCWYSKYVAVGVVVAPLRVLIRAESSPSETDKPNPGSSTIRTTVNMIAACDSCWTNCCCCCCCSSSSSNTENSVLTARTDCLHLRARCKKHKMYTKSTAQDYACAYLFYMIEFILNFNDGHEGELWYQVRNKKWTMTMEYI